MDQVCSVLFKTSKIYVGPLRDVREDGLEEVRSFTFEDPANWKVNKNLSPILDQSKVLYVQELAEPIEIEEPDYAYLCKDLAKHKVRYALFEGAHRYVLYIYILPETYY